MYVHQIRSETLEGVIVNNEVPLDASNDAFDLRGSDNQLINCKTIDTRCRTSHHCDHIQLIPEGLEPNAQYFGAIGYNNQIIGGGLKSNGSMQGAFSSDGCQSNLYVANQVIDTESEHDISINGVLSAVFENNKNSQGEPLKITLEPLRVGGGLDNAFYVLSFKDHTYEPINADQPIQDHRSQKLARYPNANYVYDFDLNLFREISESRADQYQSIPQHFNDCLAEYERRSNQGYTMEMTEDYVIIPNYMNMSESDNKKWLQRWPNFNPYELSSRDFSVKIYTKSLDALQALRFDWGKPLKINSAWRNYEHNRAVGGKTNSDHTWLDHREINASAFDVHIDSIEMGRELEKLAIKHGFNCIGRYRKSMFIHISMREPKPSGNIYQWGRWT